MRTLSIKQRKILGFIQRFLSDRSYPPSIRDIVVGCGISSTSVVDYNLDILEKGGYIRRHPDISRGIEVLNGDPALSSKVLVPIIGQIAAGEPIPVPTPDIWDVASSSETMEVTHDLTMGKTGVYALKVKGLSMVDAFINDGDIVLMQHVNSVESGEMAAVWLKSEKTATLKKVFPEAAQVRLQPANAAMSPIYAAPEDVEIQGKVIAVIRHVP
jgi:repressor LexA